MNAPLPEMPPYVPKKRDFAKPPLPVLSVICAMQAVNDLLSFVATTPDPEVPIFLHWAFEGFFTALSLMLIYGLWRGYKLARRLYLGLSFLILPLYYFSWDEIFEGSQIERVLNSVGIVLWLWMIVYLNLPAVKAHFTRRKEVEEAVKSG